MKKLLVALVAALACSTSVSAAPSSPHIYIPAIHVYAPIVGLATEANLAKGVGWWPKVGRPGQDLPVAIAGHDVTPVPGFGDHGPFHFLYEVKKGDLIAVAYEGKTYDYRVVRGPISLPVSDLKMVDPHSDVLTLSTCWPPHQQLHRLVVYARLQP